MEVIEEKIIPENVGVIKIYNPREFPFGPLGNSSRHDMVIDGKRWTTVTNYILSNMLIVPIYKMILQQAPIKGSTKNTKIEDKVQQVIANTEARQGYKVNSTEAERIRQVVLQEVSLQKMNIHQTYYYFLGQEYISTIRTAIEKAYNAKISENKVLADILLRTDNRPIIYTSGNALLGTGPDGQGQNFVGKILMQIRHNIKMTISEQTEKQQQAIRDQAIMRAYCAMSILQRELANLNDLREYVGKNTEEIIQTYLDNHLDENTESICSEKGKESVLEMYKRGQLPIVSKELEHPGYMVLAARRDNLRELQTRLQNRKAETIVRKYTEHKIKKNYPKMPIKDVLKAVEQVRQSAPDMDHYFKIREKIVSSYMKGNYDDNLSKEIETALEELPTISDQDVEKAEKMIQEEYPEEIAIPKENSSSSDGENPIKNLLGDSDDKTQKTFLIQTLQKYTGKAFRKYKNWDIEKLQDEVDKYEGRHADKEPKEGTGTWAIKVKHRNNKVEILKRITGSKPTSEYIAKLVDRYNRHNQNNQIKQGQVFVRWESTVEPKKHVKFRSQLEDIFPSFVKYVGDPVEIQPVVEQNSPELKELSPLFKKGFSVDGLRYPSVSIYITSMLITQTGVSRDFRDKKIHKRGTTVEEARKILLNDENLNIEDAFVSPDEANEIYNRRNLKSHRELLQTYARIAMKKKFEDIGLGQLLLLTGKNDLVWNDPDDLILGTGTKERRGENIAGSILMEIRQEVAKNAEKYELNRPIHSDISIAISSDPFLNSWLKMRLSDMCAVVYKMKQYLSIIGKQEEDIDSRFVNFVLNLVYQPCTGLIFNSDNNEIPMPSNFVQMVMECQGIPSKLSRDFDSEIQAVQNEIEQYDDNFWGHGFKEKDVIKKATSSQKLSKSLEAFKNKVPPPTPEQIANYEKDLLQEFEGIVPKEIKFEDKQRQEWDSFFKENNKPALPFTEIYKKIAKMKRKHNRAILQVKPEDKMELDLEQKMEINTLWKNLTQPDLSLEERNRRMELFAKQQDDERIQHYGLNIEVKTKEDLARRKEAIKEMRERKSNINRQKKEEENHLTFNIADIAQAYWNRLATMINVIAQSIKKSSVDIQERGKQAIREIIVTAELLNSQDAVCLNTENLDDPYDNCIASALCNILVGLEGFKFQYAEDIQFSNNDIDLAVGIVLGRDFEEPKPEIGEEQENETEMVFEEEFEDDMGIEDGGDQERDYGEEMEEDGNKEFGFARFGMKKNPVQSKEQVRTMLTEIAKKPVGNDIVEHFIEAIVTVKTSKLPDRIKKNRINFFATIR
jgi:predicted NAD-dependent protein-ADP-ribosyltransferase YbiA (DUF1768 family)